MTKLQGALIVGLLAFLCLHVLVADIIGIKVLMSVSTSSTTPDPTDTSEPSATGSPLCDPEGDICP